MANKTVYQTIKAYVQSGAADAVLVTREDSFLGEYFPPEAHRLEQVSGFSGSAGLALITPKEDILFVDSRYTIQAKVQSRFTVYEVPTETRPSDWINEHLSGKKVAFSPATHSVGWLEAMRERAPRVRFEPLAVSVFNSWFKSAETRRIQRFDYPESIAGESSENKCARLAQHIRKNGWDAYFITEPESVSWLLNKRSAAAPQYPVVFERGFVDADGTYLPYKGRVPTVLKGRRIALSKASTPVSVYRQISAAAKVENAPDIIQLWKACKNTVEQDQIRLACLSESRTICRFLAWVEMNKDQADEMACDRQLIAFRKDDPLYFADSFETIAAVGEHAARAHYRADKASNLPLSAAPLLLVDTGGHYLNGTTDMTRTVAVGKPTDLMRLRYTQVLQGHIDLASATLKNGEPTVALDEKAHAWLRADKVDYYHGTSHGIGLMLGVHESPPTVYSRDTFGIRAGMVFSNEPAFYSESDGFGIRLENMLMAVTEGEGVRFENLIFAPFDYRMVLFERLTVAQKEWLKTYHQQIVDRIFPMLTQVEQARLVPFVEAFGARVTIGGE